MFSQGPFQQRDDDEETIWVNAASKVLSSAHRPLHYTEIKCEILQQGLVAPGLKTTLDSALLKHNARVGKCIAQVDEKDGYFTLLNPPPVKPSEAVVIERKQSRPKLLNKKSSSLKPKPVDGKTPVEKKKTKSKLLERTKKRESRISKTSLKSKTKSAPQTLSKYEFRYRRLKRLAKDLIFINAAYCDEVTEVEHRIAEAEQHRKFLLTRVLQQQSMEESHPTSESSTSKTSHPQKTTSQNTNVCEKKQKRKHPNLITKSAVKTNKATSDEIIKGKSRKSRKSESLSKVASVPVEVVDTLPVPALPLELGHLVVCSLGNILPDRPDYHTANYFYPVGFKSIRRFVALSNQRTSCMYICTVIDNGSSPLFEIKAEGEKNVKYRGNTPLECHNKLLFDINRTRGLELFGVSKNGAQFFGFSHPAVLQLLQNIPQAKKCAKYKFKKFEADKWRDSYTESDPTVNMDLMLKEESDTSWSAPSTSQTNGAQHQYQQQYIPGVPLVPQQLTVDTSYMNHSVQGLLIPFIPNG